LRGRNLPPALTRSREDAEFYVEHGRYPTVGREPVDNQALREAAREAFRVRARVPAAFVDGYVDAETARIHDPRRFYKSGAPEGKPDLYYRGWNARIEDVALSDR
jgi:hypothetical protein